MWLKLCLLLIFMIFLFILARIVEAVSWLEAGFLSRRLLDPMSLSVLKLKALLEQRGVSFEEIVLEKKDLTDLVESSGPVTEGDVELATVDEKSTEVTNFSSGVHFFEQVEDAKDSVWLIQIVTQQRRPRLLGDVAWSNIQKKVSRFGVRAGVLDCSLDIRYCHTRGWQSPQLMLALPEGFETKANVKIHTYGGPTKESAIYNWIREKLDGKVHRITNYKTFKDSWLTFTNPKTNPEIRAVFLTDQHFVPMFFSALSVKFPGRVKFGTVDISSTDGMHILNLIKNNKERFHLNNLQVPLYMIITSERISYYGTKSGEIFSFSKMEKYLNSLYPCLNDIFIFSFLVGNILSCFEVCLAQGSIIKRFKQFVWCLIKYNILVIMLCLPLVAVFQLPYLDKMPLIGLKLIREFSLTTMGNTMRNDLFLYTKHSTILAAMFFLYMFIIGVAEYRRKGREEPEEQEENFWDFTQMRTLEHLLSPYTILNIGHPYRLQSDLEMAMRPVASENYIKQLPTWKYTPQVKSNICRGSEAGLEGDHSNVASIPCDGQDETVSGTDSFKVPQSSWQCQQHSSTARNIQSSCEKSVPTADRKLDNKSKKVDSNLTQHGKCVEMLVDNFPHGYLPSCQCVICLDDYVSGVMLCGLPCGHHFHENCIFTWLKLDNHFCPVCRRYAFKAVSSSVHIHSE
ncbi:E3 ubiquitin-protein ligase RNF103-like [Gigantopelta aegis]|uniref:E3 ubiquitin-protein ligase RNF103-like n=1 Tax=Gigantopelta aegis TaxID=1735272 RepID=UPI001B88A505|nr:E3 ubiquitin-protein ligase RNF103-like [Gigantopelta aegis]